MTYSEVGKTGIRASRLGFGGMRFPEKDGKIDREPAMKMIDAAYRAGVNYFDTAYMYHEGESEPFIGEALSRYPRESYLLATKLPAWMVKTQEDIGRLLDEQLEKCGVDYFDFYLMHSLDKYRWPVMKETRAYEQLIQKKKEGRIRALGFSYHGDIDTFREVVDAVEWDFVQIQINYLDYDIVDAKAYYDKLCEKGIPCIAMEPVRGGFLAGLPDSARRELEAVNADSAARWALRWCMDLDNIPVILSGMSSMEQVEDNLATFAEHRPLDGAERAALERAKEAIMAVRTIPCTGCRYCMDCSFGVDIPEVFAVYNRYKLFGDGFRTSVDYKELGDGRRADVCTRCGACVPMCPQGIAIPERLAEAHEEIRAVRW